VTIPKDCARLRSSRFHLSSLLFLILIFFLAAPCRFTVPSVVASPASPQSHKPKLSDHYALIFGTVWGPDNRPIYGVKVRIRRAADKKPKWELVSDHSGEFAQRVPVGAADYVVWADLKGVKTKDGETLRLAQPVSVHVEYDERVDMSLHLTH